MGKLKQIWLMPIHLIVAVMEIFTSNRDQFRKLKERRFVAGVLKVGALITVVVWLVLALMAQDQEKSRLSDSLEQLWPETRERPTETPPAQLNSH